MTEEQTYYEILGVAETASHEEIQKAYKTIIRKHHPDISPSVESAEISAMANVAKTTLLDPERRAKYDLTLSGPSLPPVEESWEPSWGAESGWGEEFEAEVEEDTAGYSDEFETPSAPIVEDDWNSPPPPPLRNSSWRGQKSTPAVIPPELLEAPVRVITRRVDAITALALSFLAPLVSILTQRSPSSEGLFIQMLSFVAVTGVFLSAAGWKLRWLWSWGYQAGVFILSYVAVYFLLSATPNGTVSQIAFPIVFSLISCFMFAPSFWSYRDQRKILKPKAVGKNNVFGKPSVDSASVAADEALDSLWSAKGLRVFRVDHPAASHVVVFANKAVLVKPVVLSKPGSLFWVGQRLVNRCRDSIVEPVLGESYIPSLGVLQELFPKNIEVTPVVVGFPVSFVEGSEAGPVSTISGVDLPTFIARILFTGQKENVVDHEAVVKMFTAIWETS
jgi:hypothetical protein